MTTLLRRARLGYSPIVYKKPAARSSIFEWPFTAKTLNVDQPFYETPSGRISVKKFLLLYMASAEGIISLVRIAYLQ